MNIFKRIFRRRSRRLRPVGGLTEEKLSEIFLAAPENPLFQSVVAIIDLHVQETMDVTIDDKLDDKKQRWHLGGADALLKLRQDLLDRESEARRERAKQENGKAA